MLLGRRIVNALVVSPRDSVSETLATRAAQVREFVCVARHVRLQVGIRGERFSAFVTHERFLAGVGDHVSVKSVLDRETPAANGTTERFVT